MSVASGEDRRQRRAPLVGFLVHSKVDLPGLLEQRCRELGLGASAHRLYLGPEELPAPGSFDALVALGSARSVNDPSVAWLEPERRLIAQAVSDGVPVLGVCFGGQLLTQVLGGTVRAGIRPEIGWKELESMAPDVVGRGPWLTWHGEVFTPPPGASLVARTELAPHAYLLGSSMAIQFHPEVTVALVSSWVPRALARGAITAEDAADLEGGAVLYEQETGRQARELFDGFLQRAGLLEEARG